MVRLKIRVFQCLVDINPALRAESEELFYKVNGLPNMDEMLDGNIRKEEQSGARGGLRAGRAARRTSFCGTAEHGCTLATDLK